MTLNPLSKGSEAFRPHPVWFENPLFDGITQGFVSFFDKSESVLHSYLPILRIGTVICFGLRL
jgi:hypothetical protein